MISSLYFMFLGIACLVALFNWRAGIFLALMAGMLQDPVRKSMPGSPAYMVLAFVPIFAAAGANLLFSPGRPWARFMQHFARIANRLALLAVSLLIALFVLLGKHGFGSWKVGVIGMISYVFPVIAVVVGYYFARSTKDLHKLITFYAVATAILLVGGLFEYLGMFRGWNMLGTEVLGMKWIRHVPGIIVDLTSGFYRSPDLMGWHAASLVMLGLVMSAHQRNWLVRSLWMAAVVWGTVLLLISGRNKMIFMPAVFISVVALVYLYLGNVSRALSMVVTFGVATVLFLYVNKQIEIEEEYLIYVGFGTAVAPERLKGHGVLSVVETLRQSGVFGEGLGSASTGARHGSGGSIRTWQESGSSKLMVELGVIGFIAVILVMVAFFKELFRMLGLQHAPPRQMLLFVGLLGILSANTASFIISHQAFGDPFIIILTGLMLGFALSFPRWSSLSDTRSRTGDP